MNNIQISEDRTLFSEFEILPDVNISVVIPVKNEETYILKTLSAFSHQVDINGDKLDSKKFEILILANNCTDRTVSLVSEFQRNHLDLNIFLQEITLCEHEANIGFVRKILFEIAFKRLSKNNHGIIMTTDGDTTVASDWIAQNEDEIKAGAGAVGGRILLCPNEILELSSDAHFYHLQDERYQLLVANLEANILRTLCDPAPRHHQHFNGSFAITTSCYLKSGGVPDVRFLEDVAFFEQLTLIDAKFRHSNKVIVHTSARCIGRTEIGLSSQLNEWKNFGKCGFNIFVGSCESTIQKFIVKKQLLDLWQNKNLTESQFNSQVRKIIPELTADYAHYANFLQYEYFGKWYAVIVEQLRNIQPEIQLSPIDDVISELEMFNSYYVDTTASHTSIL